MVLIYRIPRKPARDSQSSTQSKHKQAWAPDVLFPPAGGEMMAALGSSIYRPALFQGPSKDRPRDKPELVIFWAPSHPVQISYGTVAMSRAMAQEVAQGHCAIEQSVACQQHRGLAGLARLESKEKRLLLHTQACRTDG